METALTVLIWMVCIVLGIPILVFIIKLILILLIAIFGFILNKRY